MISTTNTSEKIKDYLAGDASFRRVYEYTKKRFDEAASLILETETGKKLAEPGRQFLIDFYGALRKANEPYQTNEP